MPTAFLVHVAAKPGDQTETLQIVADSAEQAREAVLSVKGQDAIVRVENPPLSSEKASQTGLLDGKPRLG